MANSFDEALQKYQSDQKAKAAPGPTAFDAALQRYQASQQAQQPTGAKRQIPPPNPGFSPLESLVHGVDLGMGWLDRIHSAGNAFVNTLTQGAHFASKAELDATPKQNPLSILNPFAYNAQDAVQAVKKIPERLRAGADNLWNRTAEAEQAAKQTYDTNARVPFKAFSNAAAPNAGTTQQLLLRALDLSSDVQTDPTAWLYGMLAGGAVKAAGKAGGLAKQIPAVARGLKKAEAIVNPLAQRAIESRPGAFVVKMLGNFGGGPHQELRREAIRPYELEISNAMRPSEEVLSDIERETLKQRKANPAYDRAVQDFAANHKGANGVGELVRQAVLDITQDPTLYGYAARGGGLTPQQRLTLGAKYANNFGVQPNWVIDQAQKVVQSMHASEFPMLKARIGPVNVNQWLEGMFGEPIATRPSTPGSLVRPTANITQIREAGIRNFINDLPRSLEWVKPVNPDGSALPGWVAINNPGGVLGSKLNGMQVPKPLLAFLHTELAAGGLGVSNEPKSWYIQNKDWIEWVYKNAVGTVKKGLISGTNTQTANLFSNNLVSKMALKASGINPEKLNGARIQQAYKDVMAMDKGKKVATDINEIRKYSNSFDATEVNTNFLGGPPRPAQEGKIIGAGTPAAFRAPTPGEAAGMAYLPNHIVNFQGTSERAFKLALYRTLVENGKAPKEAAATMEKYLFDYSDRGPLLEIADKFGLWPFATYPTKAFGLLMDTLVHHPEMLVKYPRLRQLANVGYQNDLQNVDPRFVTPFTLPYGNPKDKKLVDIQRGIPVGAGMEGLYDLFTGQGLGSALTSALGLGRAGQSPTESIINAPLFARLYGIEQGISPFSEAGKPKGLLAPGQPASDLPGIQMQERLKNFAASQFGGRGTIAARDVLAGKTNTDYPWQTARTPEDAALQYGLGVRTFNAQSQLDKKRNPEIKAEVKSRASKEVKAYTTQAKATAQTAKENPRADDAAKFHDTQALKRELGDAIYRLHNLPISGRVSVKGELTDEGRKDILNQAYYVYALKARLKEVARGSSTR